MTEFINNNVASGESTSSNANSTEHVQYNSFNNGDDDMDDGSEMEGISAMDLLKSFLVLGSLGFFGYILNKNFLQDDKHKDMGKGRVLNDRTKLGAVISDTVIYEDSQPDIPEDAKIVTVMPGRNAVVSTEYTPAINPKVIKGQRQYNRRFYPFETEVEEYEVPSAATNSISTLADGVESDNIVGYREALRPVPYRSKESKVKNILQEKMNNQYGGLVDKNEILRGGIKIPGLSDIIEEFLVEGKIREGYQIIPSDD